MLVSAFGCTAGPEGDRPRADYDKETGVLTRLAYDLNKNGTNDAVGHMDGTRVLRIDLDLDENGSVDRWDFYGSDQTIEKVGFSSENDGVMDAQAFYQPAGVLARMGISTRRDGLFDKTEFYEEGVLVRSEEDTDHDGRQDKWDTYRLLLSTGPNEPAYTITSSAFGDSGSGRPERRFVYGSNRTVAPVEIDPEGDGTSQLPGADAGSRRPFALAPIQRPNPNIDVIWASPRV